MEQPKATPVFATVPERLSFPKMEEDVAEFWKRIDAFKTSLKRSEGKPEYSFYDGPPFATGLPHYGHILAGTIKDTVTRYAHMTGHHVTRRFGWDCHGLPIEFEIDKQMGIKTKDQVLKLGIDKYNEACRAIVMRYSQEWEATVTRLGRWIDFENDYKTLNLSFMESVWWVFKTLYEKGLVYRGFKVMPYSTGCTTPLSNFEVGLNYQTVQDPAVTVAFPLVEDPGVQLLAWTTTPWTLPSNLALCVHPNLDYVKVYDKQEKKTFVLMELRLSHLYKSADEYEVKDKFKGAALKGKKYQPLFPYFVQEYGAKAFFVVCDEYVTAESGTGIVHQAPAFGEDDYRVCLANNIILKEVLPCPIDANGRFTAEVSDFAGQYVKEADKAIKKSIKQMGRMIVDSTIQHSYPYCWRSDTPLIYRAVPSWFVAVEKIKARLLENNKATYWVPGNVREGRFHNWLAEAHDWAVSRNRYWGTPLPLWVSDDGEEVVVVGSVAELEQLAGVTGVTDIHRHKIDHLTIPSKKGKGVLRRVEEVFDCWFESGSMPYAQVHYPFENKERFEKSFPADFIAEGIDQTRGWFYTLLVISTGLFDKPAFKNLIVNGLVLADGRKMSKRKKNYPDPMLVVSAYGADALRLYLVNSPVVRAENLNFKEDGVKDVLKNVFLPWFNAYRFFTQNAALVDFKPALRESLVAANVMDKWILAATQSLVKFVRGEMDAYRLYTVVPRLVFFVNQLTNWYLRFNRKRMKAEATTAERTVALNVLFEVLVTLARLMAPLTPFFTDYMYQNLRNALPAAEREDSVHYLPFPEYKADLFEAGIEEAVATLQEVVELGRAVRDCRKLTLKLGLREAIVMSKKPEVLAHLRQLESYVLAELNVVKLTLTDNEDLVSTRVEPDFKLLGKKFGKAGPNFVYPALKKLTAEQLLALGGGGSVTLTDAEGKAHVVETGEVQIVREFRGDTVNFEARGSAVAMVVLDASRDEALLSKWYARELTNRIQKARKKAGLLVTDPIEAYYTVDPKSPLAALLEQQRPAVEKATRLNVLPLAMLPAHARAILREESTIGYRDASNKEVKVRAEVLLAPLVVHFDLAVLRARYPALSAEDALHLTTAVGLLHYERTLAQLASGTLTFNFNDTAYTFTLGKEVFRHGRELFLASSPAK